MSLSASKITNVQVIATVDLSYTNNVYGIVVLIPSYMRFSLVN